MKARLEATSNCVTHLDMEFGLTLNLSEGSIGGPLFGPFKITIPDGRVSVSASPDLHVSEISRVRLSR